MSWFDPTKPILEKPPVGGIYRRIARFAGEFKGGVSLGLGLSALSTLLFVLLPFPIKLLIDDVLVGDQVDLGPLGTITSDTASAKVQTGMLLAGGFVLLSIAQVLANSASFYVIARTALMMIHTLRSRLVGHLRTLSLRYFADTSVGELITAPSTTLGRSRRS